MKINLVVGQVMIAYHFLLVVWHCQYWLLILNKDSEINLQA